MSRLIALLCNLLLLLVCSVSLTAQAKVPEATLTFANREIVVLRNTVQGATPEIRSQRISERLRQLDDRDLAKPLTRSEVVIDQQKGIIFSIGDRQIFVLYEADLDREEKIKLEAAAEQVETRLKEAISASLDQVRGPVIIKGVFLSLLATGITFALLWGIQHMTTFVLNRLQRRVQLAREDSAVRWAEHAWLLIKRLAQLIMAFLWVAVAYLWFTFVLHEFPITQPFATKLSGFLMGLLALLGQGVISALPGLLTVAVILFLTKAINDVVTNVFQNVDAGRTIIPGIHKDTAHATRRLIAVLIWGFGIAVAYPYLPIAESDSFKGLSVMFGFMLTLGSAGIVTQMMSGLVLIYSRALKVGDFVSVGEVMGVVKETGVLSTKIINMRNEEVTIPNAVLIGNSIKNFTSGSDKGAMVSTSVTIGYDTPWRQVEAMLINAAGRTPGLRKDPKPFVLQKSLQDFYVEYELYIQLDAPLKRVLILSDLHGQIQDEFNTHGVQIMSPHFVLQPRNNVVVSKDNWFAEPADKP